MENYKYKITKGLAVVSNYCEKTESYEIWIENHLVCKTMYSVEHKKEANANATLTAEAFNVLSEIRLFALSFCRIVSNSSIDILNEFNLRNVETFGANLLKAYAAAISLL